MAPMLTFPMDTPLSERGQQQVQAQRAALDAAGFAHASDIQLVVHSPLQRARDTCLGLFTSHVEAEQQPELPVVEHPELYERDIPEHIIPSRIRPRIDRFVEWLLERGEERIAVVGHSSFFKEMTGETFGNCSVWRFALTAEGTWEDAEPLFPCPVDLDLSPADPSPGDASPGSTAGLDTG